MKPLSTILILTVIVFASACSKNNYAQLEPKDNLYSGNSSSYGQYSAAVGSNNVSAYQSQHSPVIKSTVLGSPTIQQNEEPFYDASQNPDLAGQDYNYVDGAQQDYYVEDYGSQDLVQADVIPQTNNYYYYGNSPYYTNLYPVGDYFSMSFYLSSYYTLRPWYDPFNPYFSPYYYSVRLGDRPYRRGWYYYPSSYTSYYGLSTICYSGSQGAYIYNGNAYNGGYYDASRGANYSYTDYGNTNDYSEYATREIDNSYGGRVNAGPARSRSSISHYTNSDNSYRRREDFDPRDNQGGRIIGDNVSNSKQQDYVGGTKRRADTGTLTNTASGYTKDAYQRRSVNQSSLTVQQNNTGRRKVIIIGNSGRKQNTAVNKTNNKQRRSNYYTNRSNTRPSGNTTRTNGNRYSSPSNSNRSGNSFNRNRSNTSFSGSRNNSSNRSYSAPSRPSSGQRSAAPRSGSTQRSSSQRSSSGTRSTSSSSRGRKN